MLTTLAEALRQRRRRARLRREHEALLGLADHRLADIGLRRDDILSRISQV
ncbi:hypothetical protein [Amaricoccus sp.]|uniref:hypothetical protein n=1 Tax=Amaricoccus sp. TaxID=1872485 RepID=UPI001B40991D|nr:hypothetical protein [Amaricoccus sp.]MBP7241996.1 hypothetical protein [Amaricoccus sp.]